MGDNEWKFGLFGCFKDVRLCVVTFIVPCYTVGRNAQHFGEDCMLWGLLTCVGFYPGMVLRWRLRQEKKLKGTMMMDGTYTYCSLCKDTQPLGHSSIIAPICNNLTTLAYSVFITHAL